MKRLILLAVVLAVGVAAAGWRGRFDEQFAASVAEAEWTPAALNPVAWFQGENNAVDSAGAYDGTWSGTEAYTNGIVGKAISFSTILENQVTLPANVGVSSDNSFSIACWFRVNSDPPFQWVWLWSCRSADLRGIGMGVRPGRVVDVQVRNGTTQLSVPFNLRAVLGTWYHGVVVWDADLQQIIVFLDGIAQSPVSTISFVQATDNRLGYGRIGGSILYGNNELDDVLFFDRALTPDEITKLYNESIKRNGAAW